MASTPTPPPPHDLHAPQKPSEYLIFNPCKIGLLDLLSLLFLRRSLASLHFVEASASTKAELHGLRTDWLVQLSLFAQWLLAKISVPMKTIGRGIEFFLNLVSMNGGLLKLIWNALNFSVKIPIEGTVQYRSLLGHLDDRVELHKDTRSSSLFPLLMTKAEAAAGEINKLDLTMMAAKIAYENPAFIKDVVTNHWKMNFVAFFNGWNKFENDFTTQAFIFTDKPIGASLIVLAFRGTEPFNALDWSTDVDLSWISISSKMGKVHLGFMKALGLQDDKDFSNGFPPIFIPNPLFPTRIPAYYMIRDTLNLLLKANPDAKILVTGHSLGAALAALFPAVLSFHKQATILSRVDGVVTHAQPRVGDAVFGDYMETVQGLHYQRVVYRYDLVPRVPFDSPPVSLFTHFGSCLYYDGWYVSKTMDEVPNKNYFDIMFWLPMHMKAWEDLVKSTLLGKTEGPEYKEGVISFMFRVLGLIVPGVASHSPRDYVNGARLSRLAPATFKDIV